MKACHVLSNGSTRNETARRLNKDATQPEVARSYTNAMKLYSQLKCELIEGLEQMEHEEMGATFYRTQANI